MFHVVFTQIWSSGAQQFKVFIFCVRNYSWISWHSVISQQSCFKKRQLISSTIYSATVICCCTEQFGLYSGPVSCFLNHYTSKWSMFKVLQLLHRNKREPMLNPISIQSQGLSAEQYKLWTIKQTCVMFNKPVYREVIHVSCCTVWCAGT